MQLQMSCNKKKYRPSYENGCTFCRFIPRFPAKRRLRRPSRGFRLAHGARCAFPGGHVRDGADGEAGAILAQAAGVSRPGLSGRGRLHGSRQLGDLARRRLQVRLRAAVGVAVVQRDGDRAAVAVHPARRRRRARPRAGLPRFLSALGRRCLLAVGGSRHHRHRPRRGDRHRDRAQSAVPHSARDRRDHHRGRRVSDPARCRRSAFAGSRPLSWRCWG